MMIKREIKGIRKKGKVPLLKQIEEGLKQVKLIEEGKIKPVTLKELLGENKMIRILNYR